ncbi:MAG: NAD(P)H-dependent oxidoreductase [Ruminococcus sp.]|nr:NAD(P)H-dependent oxidoreductase [Ruminococcus sp.]
MFLYEFKGGNNEFDVMKLPDDMPEFCCGCADCILKGEDKCPHYAYVSPIVRKIESADLIIFAKPVFVGSCSGSMKTFLDYLAYMWIVHRPNGNRKPSLKMKFFFNIFKRLEQN